MLGFTERGEKYKMLGYSLVSFYVECVWLMQPECHFKITVARDLQKQMKENKNK